VNRLPDTAIVAEATALIEKAAPPSLVNHSARTYLLGAAYARKKGIDFDEEGLATAAMLHDLGLCASYRDPASPFPFVGAREVRRILAAHGADPSRIEPLVDAVELHMQMLPRWSKGNVVGLLQVGAWMDVTGLRRWAVWSEAGAIAAAFPRAGLDASFPVSLVHSMGSVRACVGLLFPNAVDRPQPSPRP
jgi:hypothetical protein